MKKLPKCLLLASLFALGLTGCDTPQTSTSESTPAPEPTETVSPTESESNASPTESETPESTPTTPVKQAHAITVVEVTGAKVSTDKNEAKEGETVTVTISEYAEDKVFGSIVINDGAVTATELTKGEKYTFVMPDGEVTIKVTIADKVYEAHALTVNAIDGFSVKFYKDNQTVTEATYRDQITVKVESNSTTQRFKSLTSADVTLTPGADANTFTFTMPDKAVALTLAVENIPSHALSSTLGKGISNATFKVEGVDATAALEGATVIFSFLFDSENYTIEEIVWTGISDPTVVSDTATAKAYQFVMPTTDVSVQVKTAEIPSYAITIDPVDHGSVEASVDGDPVSRAKAGDLITLDLSAETHYKFKSLTVTSGETEVELTTVTAEAKYTFEMPAGPVKITFVTEYVEQYFKINSITLIDPKASIATDIKEGDDVLEGTEIEVTYSRGTYNINGGAIMEVNGTAYALEEYYDSETYSTKYTGKFIMPSADADIVIYPTNAISDSGIELSAIDVDETLAKVYGATVGEKYSTSSFYFFIVPESGVKINSVKCYLDDSTSSSGYVSEQSSHLYYWGNWSSAETFRIEIDAEYVGVKQIKLNPVEGAIVDIDEEGYTPGNKVEIKIEAEPGYYIKDAEAEREDGSYFYASYSEYSGSLSFTMPEDNVIVTVEVGQTVSATIEDNPNIESAYISDSSYGGDPIELTGLVPGETYYVYATPVEGYEIVAIYYQDGKECYESWSNWSFTAPEDGGIEITFEVAQRHVVTVDESEAYEVTRLEENYLPGDEVEFKVAHTLGHKVTGVSSNVDGLVITEDEYTSGLYSFTMPSEDVQLIITTEEVATHTLTFVKPEGMGSISIRDENGDYITSGDQVNEGETLTMGLGKPSTGFTLDAIELVSDDTRTPLTAGTGGEYEFAMPSADAEIVLTVTEEAKHPITLSTEDDRISLTIKENSYGEEFEQGYVGHSIYATVTLTDSTGNYYLDASEFTIKTASGADVELENTLYDGKEVLIRFTMPDEEVIITPVVAQYETYVATLTDNAKAYIASYNLDSKYGTELDPTAGYKETTKITVTSAATLDTDNYTYTLYVYYLNGEEEVKVYENTFSYAGDYWSFNVPASDYVIDVVVTPKA